MNRITNRTLALALAALVSLLLAGHALAGSMTARPAVVKVHADWCGTCTRLNPVWDRIEAAYGDRAEVVLLDVTDKDRVEASRARAESLGLGEFFDAYKSKTGVIAVIDAKGETIAVLKGETDFTRYTTLLDAELQKDAS